jgi:hypothetical protein
MSSTDGEIGMRNMTDKATYERLEKDVANVKDDIGALADQITDALNTFAGTAGKQARRPGCGCIGRGNTGECHHRAPACDRRPRAWPWLPDRRDVASLRS